MRKILGIAYKDTLVRFASRSEWVFFLILPMVFVFIIGGGFAGAGQAVDRRIRLLVVNDSTSTLAADLVIALSASTVVRADVLPRADAQREFDDGNAAALLTVPATLVDDALSGAMPVMLTEQRNDPDAGLASLIVQQAVAVVSQPAVAAAAAVAEAERLRPFDSAAARAAFHAAALTQARAVQASARARLDVVKPAHVVNTGYNAATQASAGQLITWVFIPMIGIAAMFAYERQNGTQRRLLTTPTGRATLLLGVLSGQLATALVQMALLVVFGMLVMKVDYGQSPLALALVLLAFGLAGTAFGTMLGTFVRSEGQANGLSIMLGMVLALLGGCWYPLELFPDTVRTAVHVLPTTWVMRGLTDIVSRGQGVAGILLEVGALLGFAALFFTVGVWRFVRSER